MISDKNLVVSVCMITFNHEEYIREAIDGVLMQKCSFKTELVIGEDFSTDRTRTICQEYASNYSEVNLLPSDTNMGMIPNFIRTIQACNGKYIAFCEGDDYWTDPQKLQKQIDFLENNPDYGMIHTGFKWYNCETGKVKLSNKNIPTGDIYEHILIRSFIGTLTAVVREFIIVDYLEALKNHLNNWKMGDRPLWLYIASRSKVAYLDEITSVYRQHGHSATSFSSVKEELEFFKQSYQVRFFFMEKIKNTSPETRLKIYENYYRGLLEYNSKIFDKKSSKEAFLSLKKSKHSVLKDYFLLLRSKGPFYGKVSSLLMFLFFEKKAFIKGLVNDLSF